MEYSLQIRKQNFITLNIDFNDSARVIEQKVLWPYEMTRRKRGTNEKICQKYRLHTITHMCMYFKMMMYLGEGHNSFCHALQIFISQKLYKNKIHNKE